MLVHGANLKAKENHPKKYRDDKSKQYLSEIRVKYDEWHKNNLELSGPFSKSSPDELHILQTRVSFFEEYKNFLDQQHYAEHFDSRSNLHSSALEEFMYYLFKDLINDFGERALVGKSSAFKDIFFAASNYSEMLESPRAKIETKDHDFVIGVKVQASLTTTKPPSATQQNSENISISLEPLVEQNLRDSDVEIIKQPNINENTESDIEIKTSTEELTKVTQKLGSSKTAEIHLFDIPAVVIECKTYLDKTMLEGSSKAAEELKARNPNAIYLVVMEWIKLSDQVNLRKYKVDQIYVLRKQKNTDREYRYDSKFTKKPIDIDTVSHLYNTVRQHLTTDWQTTTIESGIQRGWLI